MLKNFLAKLGVGAAKIDLVLNKQHYELGDVVQGCFHVQGGSVAQHINRIDVDFEIQIRVRDQVITHPIARIPVSDAFEIQPNEQKELPFTHPLPVSMPISRGGVSYMFNTRLDIASGIDGADHDQILILAPVRFESIIQALDIIGLREKADSGKFNGYTQEFEFYPMGGQFKGQLDEVEFEAAIEEDGIRLLLEVDLLTMFGFGEKELKQEIFLTNEQLADAHALARHLEAVIREMMENPDAYPASRYRTAHGHGHGHSRGHGGLTNSMGGLVASMVGGLVLGALASEAIDLVGDEVAVGDVEGGIDDGGDYGDDF
ncbi:MAG: sporulation protein [Tumebacillaceae bacterium]